MSYVVKEVKGEKVIFEKDTEVSILYKKSEKQIQDTVRKLNLGSGFNGWTPQFFANNRMYK